VVVPACFHEGKHRADCGLRLRQMPQTRHDRWHAGPAIGHATTGSAADHQIGHAGRVSGVLGR
jgi:hypothetical protein